MEKIYELPENSYHYRGYDSSDGSTCCGYTYVRDPEPGDHLDVPVSYIEIREDVTILAADEGGVTVQWDIDKECPIK